MTAHISYSRYAEYLGHPYKSYSIRNDCEHLLE